MIYRSLLILSFIAVNGLILFGISQTLSFLNTGADRSGMLHVGIKNKQAYTPSVKWKDTTNPGRPIEKQTMYEIQKDYINSWYVRNVAFKEYDSIGVFDFYTENARNNILKTLLFNQSQNIKISSTTISHNLFLDFYSADGQLVIFEDRNLKSYKQITQQQELKAEVFDTENYKIAMLLEDGFWRIRHIVRQKSSQDTATINTSPYIKEDKIYINDVNFKIKGINYYPKDSPWDMFGDNFNTKIIQKDFEIIKNAGLNTVRIFVPYEDFGKENVKSEKLSKLVQVMDLAQDNQLKVVVTLFDFYGNYAVEDWTFTHRHVEKITNRLKNHSALLMWDLKNEPDLDFKSRNKTTVIAWLKEISRQVKAVDSVHPITIGWSSIGEAKNLKDIVDVVSFHYYEDIEDFNEKYKLLGDISKPRVLQEFGMSSYQGLWAPFGNSEDDQADYHKSFQRLIDSNQLNFMSWTLYDFDKVPTKVVGKLPWRKNKQKCFGFINQKGNKKPSFKYIK